MSTTSQGQTAGIDPALVNSIDLPQMVHRAIASQGLAQLFQDSALTETQVLDEVYPKLPDYLSVAADGVAAMQKAELDYKSAYDQRDKEMAQLPQRPSGRQLGFALLAVALSLTALIVAALRGQVIPSLSASRYMPLVVLAALAIFALLAWGLIAAIRWSPKVARYLDAFGKITSSDAVSTLQTQATKLRDQLRQTIYDQGVRSEVNGILSKATTPSYANDLGDAAATGLSEIFIAGHEVETQARRDLDDLLKLPGGSIGLAGSRGSGKTTLMTLVARRPSSKDKAKACYVMCPAPVEYSGRDYLATLFLLLCNWVIEDRSPRGSTEPFSRPDSENRSPQSRNPVFQLLVPAARYATNVGACLLLLGLGSAYYLAYIEPTRIPAAPAATSQTSPVNSASQKSALATPASQPSASTASAPPPTRQMHLVQFATLIGIDSKWLIQWGAILIAAAWLTDNLYRRYYRFPRRFLGIPGLPIPKREMHRWQERPRDAQDSTEDALAAEARSYRESLRFQQSYSSGWSGSLKLPIGLESSRNDAQSLSRNQRSLPEIVGEFQAFLRRVAAEYGRVTICIDELDKMESDDKAHLFLNEIKAIFGVPNVFYLVSVSENAISAFERRGLPFRDVFDSSFDAIVHVDYLRLSESKVLLKRRTTRLPEPFLNLCHCMSGGLPRDLIRACRQLLDVSKEERETSLIPLARRVFSHETRGKARGMSIAVSKLASDADQTLFLSSLTFLLTERLDEATLLTSAVTLLARADELRDRVTKYAPGSDVPIREQVLQLSSLASLQTEFGLYLAYVATVLEVFIQIEASGRWIAAETDAVLGFGASAPLPLAINQLDQLAATRQSLAISASIGRQRLVDFRSSRGFDVTGIYPQRPASPASV